jgi:GAF domain-containing protein
MRALQSIAESLLIETSASRAVVQVVSPDRQPCIEGEAVSHGMRQIRNDGPAGDLGEDELCTQLAHGGSIMVQADLERATPPVARPLVERYGARARMLAPVLQNGALAAVVSVHDSRGTRQWSPSDVDALQRASESVRAVLDQRVSRHLAMTEDDLRDAAIQAVLDGVRQGLRVQRCTLRQNVSALYAFPVTHESRGEGVWSLRGDFTIVQTGQPVIEKMIAERLQVVQNDTRNASSDPLFHVMLKHYGDMRAQIVTPLFREGGLAAVLSIHSLKELRTWSAEETALARSAAQTLGLIVGATLS